MSQVFVVTMVDSVSLKEAMTPVMNSHDDEADDFSTVFAAAQVAAADVALITDAAQNVVHTSDSFTAMTGYEQAELVGVNCRLLQGPGTDAHTTRRIREQLASGEVFEGEILNYRKNGSPFWTVLKIIPTRVGATTAITHYVSVQHDISNQVALLRHLQSQADHDTVTGLLNRGMAQRAVDEAVKRSLHRNVTVAVGLIDLDDFRLVNNRLGHAAGDEVLRQWAARMTSRLREGDVLARMGGDEFVLILKNVTRHTAQEDLPDMLHEIHRAVEEPFVVADQQVSVGMSLGMVLVPEDGTDAQRILRSADEALRTAKERRNHQDIWWETAEDSSVHPPDAGDSRSNDPRSGAAGGASPEDYRGALNHGNIVVHLQPVVDLRDGSVHLLEALARLHLPTGHVAYPDEFLPHIGTEELRVLFAGVLDMALATLAAWDRQGIHHHVSVNLPPAVLLDRTTPAFIQGLLHAHDIQPERLGLELLESEDLDLEEQRATLQVLASLKVGLAMDDLGSGYSNLQRLSSFPFSAIKLDRGLFQHVDDRPVETLSVIATLIQLGKDLGMNVVVEGLENEALTEAVAVLGAPLGQGFYLATPMSPDDCLRWFDSFTLPPLVSPVRTPLGALAHHWQFARLAAPHPLELDRCPLTPFLDEAKATVQVKTWHSHQHETPGIQPRSSQLLIAWLTSLIRENSPQESGSRLPSPPA